MAVRSMDPKSAKPLYFLKDNAHALTCLRRVQKTMRARRKAGLDLTGKPLAGGAGLSKEARLLTAKKTIRHLPLDDSDVPLTGNDLADVLDQEIADRHGVSLETVRKWMEET